MKFTDPHICLEISGPLTFDLPNAVNHRPRLLKTPPKIHSSGLSNYRCYVSIHQSIATFVSCTSATPRTKRMLVFGAIIFVMSIYIIYVYIYICIIIIIIYIYIYIRLSGQLTLWCLRLLVGKAFTQGAWPAARYVARRGARLRSPSVLMIELYKYQYTHTTHTHTIQYASCSI